MVPAVSVSPNVKALPSIRGCVVGRNRQVVYCPATFESATSLEQFVSGANVLVCTQSPHNIHRHEPFASVGVIVCETSVVALALCSHLPEGAGVVACAPVWTIECKRRGVAPAIAV